MNFIHVFNDELKNRLIKAGYLLISSMNNISIFENNMSNKFSFAQEDKSKYQLTNRLVF